MEKLERLISFQKIRRHCEGVLKPTTVLLQVGSPVRSLMVFAGFQKPENAFPIPVPFRIAVRFPLILVAETNLVHHIIEPLDHMKRINTDLCMRKIFSCNGEKSVAHVAAEEFHPLALFRRELAEVLSDSGSGDLIQNIDYRVGIPVGDTAVILAEAPFVGFGAPDAAVSLEFIDTDGFRKFFRKAEANRFENGLDDARRNTVMSGNLGEGKRLCKIQKNGIVKSLCHVKRRMHPVRIFIERRMTFLAEKPAFMESDSGSSVMRRNMAYGLPGPGIFDDAVGGAAAGTKPLTRRREIQGDEIVVPEGLDILDGCFLRKLCEIVRCFHGRFVTS